MESSALERAETEVDGDRDHDVHRATKPRVSNPPEAVIRWRAREDSGQRPTVSSLGEWRDSTATRSGRSPLPEESTRDVRDADGRGGLVAMLT